MLTNAPFRVFTGSDYVDVWYAPTIDLARKAAEALGGELLKFNGRFYETVR